MRKLILVLLGLLLLGGAVGAATFRYVLGPEMQMRTKGVRSFDSYRSSPGPVRQPRLSAIQIFDIVVNVLNVVVGIVGICLTLAGLRLQRTASR